MKQLYRSRNTFARLPRRILPHIPRPRTVPIMLEIRPSDLASPDSFAIGESL